MRIGIGCDLRQYLGKKNPPIKREVYDQEMKSKDEENGEVANGGG